jgi:hypothetical protein
MKSIRRMFFALLVAGPVPLYAAAHYPDFGGVTEFFTPHFIITFGLPTTRNVAGPLNRARLNGTDSQPC